MRQYERSTTSCCGGFRTILLYPTHRRPKINPATGETLREAADVGKLLNIAKPPLLDLKNTDMRGEKAGSNHRGEFCNASLAFPQQPDSNFSYLSEVHREIGNTLS